MRHIPEDELHAYLDQALSRQQCVEIESHLAFCPACRADRDAIAALRDRTTALLARLAPPRRLPPPFETIRQRHADRSFERQHRIRSAMWAASLIAAVGLGWTGSRILGPAPDGGTRPEPSPFASVETAAPAPAPTPGERPAAREIPVRDSATPAAPAPATVASADRPNGTTTRSQMPTRVRREPAESTAAAPESAAVVPGIRAPAFEFSSIGAPEPSPELELGGVWRTVSWASAQAAAGDALPHLDGLPVVEVQVQGSRQQGARPVTMVAQQLASGEVIRTFEGPVSDLSQLLAKRTPTDPEPGALISDSTGHPAAEGSYARAAGGRARTTMAMQRGDRMLAITGSLPEDSLRAMIRRLNAEMRSK